MITREILATHEASPGLIRSILFGAHHFIQKIIKNALTKLMTFRLDSSKFILKGSPYYCLNFIFINTYGFKFIKIN
jgi:hypothetical protein